MKTLNLNVNHVLPVWLALAVLPVLTLDPLAVVMVFALIILVIYVLGKLKLLGLILAVFAAILVAFLIMSAVPALQVEPVYSVIKNFLESLPEYVKQFMDYIGRLLSGLMGGG